MQARTLNPKSTNFIPDNTTKDWVICRHVSSLRGLTLPPTCVLYNLQLSSELFCVHCSCTGLTDVTGTLRHQKSTVYSGIRLVTRDTQSAHALFVLYAVKQQLTLNPKNGDLWPASVRYAVLARRCFQCNAMTFGNPIMVRTETNTSRNTADVRPSAAMNL
jgi:hypothetical protein